MPKVNIYDMTGAVVGEMELSDAVFGITNEVAMHTVVKAQLANRRQGTQSALTRAEVSGGIKPWRQKGTAVRVLHARPAVAQGRRGVRAQTRAITIRTSTRSCAAWPSRARFPARCKRAR